jgi:hypothetical protein
MGAALLCGLLGNWSPASAQMIFVTEKGTITSGYDETGLFGSVGSLVGDSYSVKYTFREYTETNYTTPDPQWNYSHRDSPLPATTTTTYITSGYAVVTVNGHSVSIGSDGSFSTYGSTYNYGVTSNVPNVVASLSSSAYSSIGLYEPNEGQTTFSWSSGGGGSTGEAANFTTTFNMSTAGGGGIDFEAPLPPLGSTFGGIAVLLLGISWGLRHHRFG